MEIKWGFNRTVWDFRGILWGGLKLVVFRDSMEILWEIMEI